MKNPNICGYCGGDGDIDVGQMCLPCGGTGKSGKVVMPSAVYMSFGGGVQSTAIAMLCVHRDERLLKATNGMLPSSFLFADTGDEPEAVYRHVEWMRGVITDAGFEFKTVSKGGRLGDTVSAGRLDIPVWVDTEDGKKRPMRRACTVDWKATVLDREAKRMYGVNLRRKAEQPIVAQWYGISRDEAQRMRLCKDSWRWFVYPLIAMRWTREDCISYLSEIGVDAPKSACVFCPFHGDAVWRSLSDADMARAIEVEEAMVGMWEKKEGAGILARLRSRPTMHPSGELLSTRPFDHGENNDTMDNECAGICGV